MNNLGKVGKLCKVASVQGGNCLDGNTLRGNYPSDAWIQLKSVELLHFGEQIYFLECIKFVTVDVKVTAYLAQLSQPQIEATENGIKTLA